MKAKYGWIAVGIAAAGLSVYLIVAWNKDSDDLRRIREDEERTRTEIRETVDEWKARKESEQVSPE